MAAARPARSWDSPSWPRVCSRSRWCRRWRWPIWSRADRRCGRRICRLLAGRRRAGRRRRLVGAGRAADAGRRPSLHRRLGQQHRARTGLRLQRPRPHHRRRDRCAGGGGGGGGGGANFSGIDRHRPAVQLAQRRPDRLAAAGRAARPSSAAGRAAPARRAPTGRGRPRSSGAAGCWSPAPCSATPAASSTPTTRSNWPRRSRRWSASATVVLWRHRADSTPGSALAVGVARHRLVELTTCCTALRTGTRGWRRSCWSRRSSPRSRCSCRLARLTRSTSIAVVGRRRRPRLAAATAYALATAATPHTGSIPSAGPTRQQWRRRPRWRRRWRRPAAAFGGGTRWRRAVPAGSVARRRRWRTRCRPAAASGGSAQHRPAPVRHRPGRFGRHRAAAAQSTADGADRQRRAGGGAGGAAATTVNSALTALLKASTTKWAAATSARRARLRYELASGKAVMAIGGFSGSDNAPISLAQFEKPSRPGEIHYFIGGGGRAAARAAAAAAAVRSPAGSRRTSPPPPSAAHTVYDLTKATS